MKPIARRKKKINKGRKTKIIFKETFRKMGQKEKKFSFIFFTIKNRFFNKRYSFYIFQNHKSFLQKKKNDFPCIKSRQSILQRRFD